MQAFEVSSSLQQALQEFVSANGYWAESMGIPLPGETILVLAAIYAAADPTLNIWVVIAVATIGSIMGDNAGYWIGRKYAYTLLVRYGRYIGMSTARIKVGQYLFRQHGGKVVFLGRFVALLRILAASSLV
jgi:membrane protein DedA with SNARE-associated domain